MQLALADGADVYSQNFYERLGLKQGASETEVKQAYRKMAKEFHPDRATDAADAAQKTKIMQLLGEAYSGIKAGKYFSPSAPERPGTQAKQQTKAGNTKQNTKSSTQDTQQHNQQHAQQNTAQGAKKLSSIEILESALKRAKNQESALLLLSTWILHQENPSLQTMLKLKKAAASVMTLFPQAQNEWDVLAEVYSRYDRIKMRVNNSNGEAVMVDNALKHYLDHKKSDPLFAHPYRDLRLDLVEMARLDNQHGVYAAARSFSSKKLDHLSDKERAIQKTVLDKLNQQEREGLSRFYKSYDPEQAPKCGNYFSKFI